MAEILIIEDDLSVAASLKRLLEDEGNRVQTTSSPEEGLTEAQEQEFDVVVTDLQMRGPSGLEVVKRLHAARPRLPVILMTAYHTTDVAIEATKLGAYDYILKPLEPFEEFVRLINRASESGRLASEPVGIGEPSPAGDSLVGKSLAMQAVYKEIGRVATTPWTVLIRGETGTGKELVARAIFQHSHRREKPFIVVNCAAIPETLLESELFGHEAGAFTNAKTCRIGRFEQAHEGTILLDEIGDMSPGTQAKLLRVLQENTVQRLGGRETIHVDVRVLAATHRNLELAIKQREFREDLYYRLNVAVIWLPPLRERTEDVPDLARHFLQRYGAELGTACPAIAADAMRLLQAQSWYGNVRELFNVLRQAALLSRGHGISRDEVVEALSQTNLIRLQADQTLAGFISKLLADAQLGEVEDVQAILMEMIERESYGEAIRLAGGDQSKAARWLGVSRPTLREKLTRYSLLPPTAGARHGRPE